MALLRAEHLDSGQIISPPAKMALKGCAATQWNELLSIRVLQSAPNCSS